MSGGDPNDGKEPMDETELQGAATSPGAGLSPRTAFGSSEPPAEAPATGDRRRLTAARGGGRTVVIATLCRPFEARVGWGRVAVLELLMARHSLNCEEGEEG